MGNYLRNLISFFMTDKCYNEFFVNFNIYDADCLKQTISKGLGVGIILGSALVKLPQILKLYNAKSAEGISFIGVLLELIAVTSSASYSYSKAYPFSSWGESLFLMLETAVIGFLVLLYSTKRRNANAFAAAYSMIVFLLFTGMVPSSVLWSMQVANVPIVVIGKMIQAVQNFRNGHTGQLSAVTVFLLFFGGLARIFTSIQETGDRLIVLTFVMSSLTTGILGAQILYYWNATTRLMLKKKKKTN